MGQSNFAELLYKQYSFKKPNMKKTIILALLATGLTTAVLAQEKAADRKEIRKAKKEEKKDATMNHKINKAETKLAEKKK